MDKEINNKSIFLFDFDGTITSQELLPLIARETDIFQEIESLTDATIKGVIPFESSFKLRCKLLADVPFSKVHDIVKSIHRYESIIKFIKQNLDRCYIITGNLDVWLKPIIEEFGVTKVKTSKSNPDKILIEHILNKGVETINIRKQHSNSTIVAIGDGMGDVSMFQESDIAIAFGGTHKPIESLVKTSNYVVRSPEQLVKLLNSML